SRAATRPVWPPWSVVPCLERLPGDVSALADTMTAGVIRQRGYNRGVAVMDRSADLVLIRGFGVRVPGGAPVLNGSYSHRPLLNCPWCVAWVSRVRGPCRRVRSCGIAWGAWVLAGLPGPALRTWAGRSWSGSGGRGCGRRL